MVVEAVVVVVVVVVVVQLVVLAVVGSKFTVSSTVVVFPKIPTVVDSKRLDHQNCSNDVARENMYLHF